MAFWKDFGKGVSSHITAISFIAKNNLWTYFIFPILITAALFYFGMYAINSIVDNYIDWLFAYLSSFLKYQFLNHAIFHFIKKTLGWFAKSIAEWILGFLFLKIIRYVVLIICSPVMAALSKRTDEILTGIKTPFIFSNFLKDIFRGILIVLRNMFFETLILFGLFILFCFPIVGWLMVPLMWINGWYFLGFNMMDYTFERRRMKIRQGARFTRKHKGIAIGNGLVYSFLLWIPILGICLAPILSSVAATLATVEALDKK